MLLRINGRRKSRSMFAIVRFVRRMVAPSIMLMPDAVLFLALTLIGDAACIWPVAISTMRCISAD